MSFRRSRVGAAFLASVVPLATACTLLTSLDGLTGGATGAGSDAAQPQDAGGSAHPGEDAPSEAFDAGPTPLDAEAGAKAACTDGGILCNGACVDPTSDPANCNRCGNVCASGLCGATLAASLATTPAGWMFNGSASYNTFAPSAQLTATGVTGQAGTFVYATPMVVDTMDAQFQFRIGLNGGTRSDGMGFMIEQTGPTAVGGAGASLGMTGLTGFGVELDIYDNAACGDTSDDHVGIDDLSTCTQVAGMPTSLSEVDVSGSVDLADTHWHSADIAIASGSVTVTIDGKAVVADVPLTGFVTGAPYYVGFAGATGGLVLPDGGGGFRQEVKDVTITFPTPRCL